MSERTPNYVLISAHIYPQGSKGYDMKTMDAGTFVRPIELPYVPKHVLDDSRWKDFNKDKEIFCYTRFGIIPIPKFLIREA